MSNFRLLRGYDGLDLIWASELIPVGVLTETKVQEALRVLAASGSLSYEEIVGAHLKRKTKRANDLLQVKKNGPFPEYACGANPHFTAIVVDKNGKRPKYPEL